jgi:hypothetical protein
LTTLQEERLIIKETGESWDSMTESFNLQFKI